MAALVPLPQTPLPLDVLCMVPDPPDLLQAEGGVQKNEDCRHQDRDIGQDMCHHGPFRLLVRLFDISITYNHFKSDHIFSQKVSKYTGVALKG